MINISKKLLIFSALLSFAILFSACQPTPKVSEANSTPLASQDQEPTLSAGQATGTAILSRQSTVITEATLYPATPFPIELYPTYDWTGWTPSPGEIVASDSGKTYSFVLTSRFSIVLKEADFPAANLKLNCVPDFVLGRISNVEGVPPDYYVIRYEGSGIGQCIIQNDSFEVTINITEHP